MRLLVLLPDLFGAIGGIAGFDRCLVRALGEMAEDKGWRVTVLALNDKREPQDSGISLLSERIQYVPFQRSKARFSALAIQHSLNSSAIIVGHINFAPLCLCLGPFREHRDLLLVAHGNEVWKKLPLLQKFGMKAVRKILCVSAYTRDQMILWNRLDKERFEVFPNTLELCEVESPGPKSIDAFALPAGMMMLTVARLDASEDKGIDSIIRAMPSVLDTVPDAFLVVIGEGSDRARLEELAIRKKVRHKVVFAGRVSDSIRASFYAACDLFVLPSPQEGFGIVFLEAMSHAKPCVALRAGGVPEVVEDGVTGRLCEPCDDKCLSETLIDLLKSKAQRHAMGKAGKERLDREFSFASFKARLENILSKCAFVQ